MKLRRTMVDLYEKPWMGRRGKGAIARVFGAERRFMDRVASDEERARAASTSFDELAQEALSAKRAGGSAALRRLARVARRPISGTDHPESWTPLLAPAT